MRGLAVARAKNRRPGYLSVLLAASFLGAIYFCSFPVAAQSGSMIGATVCAPTSTITIDTPVSDSVVTNPTVQLSGSVTQASQIEIEIDDEFDSSIQLNMGQISYSGSVQLPVGTHTIKVTAVSVCPSASGTATSVVTFEAPPQTPSTGSSTPTNVGGGGGGVTVGSGSKIEQPNESGQRDWLQRIIIMPLQTIGSWLDINYRDSDYFHVDTMGSARAIVFGVGLYLAIIGLAPSLVAPIAALPVLATIIPGDTGALRVRWMRRTGRIVGVLLIIATFLV